MASFSEEDEESEEHVKRAPGQIKELAQPDATPEEIALMQQFYNASNNNNNNNNNSNSTITSSIGDPALVPGFDVMNINTPFAVPTLPPGHEGDADLVAWDKRIGTYVLDDPETGALLVWNSAQGEWIADEEFQDQFEHLGDDFILDEEDSDEAKGNYKKKPPPRKVAGAESKTNQTIQTEEGTQAVSEQAKEKKKKKKKSKKRKVPVKSVYFKGIPEDATLSELVEFFRKAGVIEKDPLTMQPKVKIYTDDDGKPKGDGLVTYFVDLAVENAFSLLDGAELRPGQGGYPITVELPQFDASKKQRLEDGSAKVIKSKKVKRYNQLNELAWDEGEQKHVIIKHVFDPAQAVGDVFFYDELKKELDLELSKCGPIQSLKIFERNPEGVVAVKYSQDWGAARCIEVMNGRWFDGRQLLAEYYDGFSNYFVAESEEDRLRRDAQWEQWLQGNDEAKEMARQSKTDGDEEGDEEEHDEV